jgi:hypothetical protein
VTSCRPADWSACKLEEGECLAAPEPVTRRLLAPLLGDCDNVSTAGPLRVHCLLPSAFQWHIRNLVAPRLHPHISQQYFAFIIAQSYGLFYTKFHIIDGRVAIHYFINGNPNREVTITRLEETSFEFARYQ